MSEPVRGTRGRGARGGRGSVVLSRCAAGVLAVVLATGCAFAARWVVSPAPGHVVITPAVTIDRGDRPGPGSGAWCCR